MKRKKKDLVEWLEFELLADIPGLVHGVFLKNTADATMREILGVDTWTLPKACHGATVLKASEQAQVCDGLITQETSRALAIRHADCQAAIFYDPVQRAIGNIHCGWRGNVQNIYAQAVLQMQREFNSHPADLLVCISPSLGPAAAEFKNYREEFPESFRRFQVQPNYFDLWEVSRQQLLELGVLPHHIEIAGICTYSHPEDFCSYRLNKTSERNTTCVALVSTQTTRI